MTPDEVLDRAADELLEHGWTQGNWEDPDGRMCLSGAINKAVSGRAGFDAMTDDQHSLRLQARRALMDEINQAIICWNDFDGRAEDEVHDVLRNTAKKLREET